MNCKSILITAVMTSAFVFAPLASAVSLRGQAGDIDVGTGYTVTKNDIASYYKDGKTGTVTFSCDLVGENVKALLYGGKNLAANPPAILSPGFNGFYTWTLHDLNEETGNIKVKLLNGDSAYVRCVSLQ